MGRIIDAGGPRDRAAIQLSMRRGSHIRNERRRESAPEALRASVREFSAIFPSAKLRSITATYNCFGLTFGGRRAWVHEDALPLIFEEDEYRLTTTPSVGDLVIYRSDEGDIE